MPEQDAEHDGAQDLGVEVLVPLVMGRDRGTGYGARRGCHAEPPIAGSRYCAVSASRTESAVMFTMRRTVLVGVRMCAGRAAPSRIGPTVMPSPATTLSAL